MRLTTLVALAVWSGAGMALADNLSLGNYLDQVTSKGPDFRAAQASAEGLDKQSRQQDLLYAPTLSASYGHLDDQQQQIIPFNGTRTQADAVSLTLSKKFTFGPSLSVGYAFNNISLTGSPFITSPYYTVAPTASLSLPLFKDFGGSQTSAGVHKVQYQLESAAKGAAFQREQALFDAKVAYWNLALIRSENGIRKDTLERSQKIWDWTKRRVARNLADPPDALQAEASVRVAELDLQMVQEKERTARLKFNRFRGIETDEVPEQVESLEDSLTSLKVEVPSDLPPRLDLKAVEFSAKQQEAAYDEARQNIFPDVTAYASWTGNGLDKNNNIGPANDDAFRGLYPTYKLGAQLTLPLDVFTASRVSEGYKLNSEGAALALKNKRIQVSQEWRDLIDRMRDLDKRLAMAAQIETLQKSKADQERARLELGRTTQFQLLSFENDYAQARMGRLGLVLEKLSVLAMAQWWLADEAVGKGEKK